MSKKIKIFLVISAIFCTFALSAQETKVYKVDENTGLKEITPTVIIKGNKVYNVSEYGLPEITPTQIIRDNKIYNVENGLPNIRPTYIIKTDSIKIWHQERN